MQVTVTTSLKSVNNSTERIKTLIIIKTKPIHAKIFFNKQNNTIFDVVDLMFNDYHGNFTCCKF